jgi:hypothetical protein
MRKLKEIDLLKIGNIKTKSQLKKFGPNKELLNGNYLFHYLILTNNLTGIKLYSHPIYRYNIDGLNGFILAAKEKRYRILDYLLKKYKSSSDKNLIYLKNKKNMNFLNFLEPDEHLIKLIEDNPDIQWLTLFENYAGNQMSAIDNLFLNGNYTTINKIISLLKFNYKKYLYGPYYFTLINNNNLSIDKIEKVLNKIYEQDSNIFKYTDDNGLDLSYAVVFIKNENGFPLLKYIVSIEGDNLDHYTPITTNHIFLIAYKIGMRNNNYEMAEYILENTMKNHDFNETDMNGNNIIDNLLEYRLVNKKGNYKIEKQLMSKYDDWTRLNINKRSAFDLIIKLDYKKYHKFLTNRPSHIPKDIDKKWKKYVKKLPIKKNDDKVEIINAPYVHSNMFQAKFTDMGIFGIYLSEKYKDLYLPIYNGKDVKPEWNDNMLLPDNLLKYNNNFPWIILWNNENNYWIHPYLNKLINENKKKYKAAFVFISMRLPHGGLHAGLIFYNFITNVIQRFDPYGNTSIVDGTMDEILESRLTEGTDMKYCSPECYFPVSGFQTLSDENNLMNQKMGDFGGYCLAWSIWYVEHNMINMNVDTKKLIRKTINKFMNMNIKPMEYIRNYANHISKFRIAYMKKIGIPENLASNENLNHTNISILNKSLINYFNP